VALLAAPNAPANVTDVTTAVQAAYAAPAAVVRWQRDVFVSEARSHLHANVSLFPRSRLDRESSVLEFDWH
jgi:hypothetical protein